MFSFLNKSQNESIEASRLDDIIDQIQLIDIREPQEVAWGKIKTAQNIPMGELLNAPEHYLKKDEKYYIMCQSGMRSMRTVRALKDKGYQVVNVQGGMSAYTGKYRN